jgi:hypothetical protein
MKEITCLLLCEAGTKAHHINYIPLYHAHVGQVTPPKRIKFFAFALPLLFLLCEALVTTKIKIQSEFQTDKCSLFLGDRLEFDHFVGIHSSTSRTPSIEIFLDMVPTKATNLKDELFGLPAITESGPHLIPADTWLEVEI